MQQDIPNLIAKSVNVWVLAIFALIGVLSPFVGLATSAAVAAGWISEDSGWARFAAKFFSFTLHAKSYSLPSMNATDPKKALNGLITLGVIAVLCSCSLESARSRRINSQLVARESSTPAQPRQVNQCEFFDGVHVWGDWVAGGSVAVGAGAALVASKTDGSTSSTALTTGIVAGGIGLVSLGVAEVSAKTWQERCSQ